MADRPQDDGLAQLHHQALCLEKQAVVLLVELSKKYQNEIRKMLAARYSDGEVDGMTLHLFADAIQEAEEYAARGGDE